MEKWIRCKEVKEVTKEMTKASDAETKESTKQTIESSVIKPSYSHLVKAIFDWKVNSDLLLFGEYSFALSELKSLIFGAEYNFGNDTKLKAKVILS